MELMDPTPTTWEVVAWLACLSSLIYTQFNASTLGPTAYAIMNNRKSELSLLIYSFCI